MILDRLPGQNRSYLAVDTHVIDADILEEDIHQFSAEILQKIDLPLLPPSHLHLKISSLILLLRNLTPPEGLCNGTRIVVTCLRKYYIEARVLGGDFNGQLRVLPRIKLFATDEGLGITI